MTKCLYANFWFMFACLNSVEFFDKNCYNLQFLICLHARIRRDVSQFSFNLHVQILSRCLQWFISQIMIVFACLWFDFFVCFSSNEMFWQLIYISFSTFVAYHEKIYINFDEMSWQTIHISQFWLCNIFRFLFTCSDFVEMFTMIRISQFTIVFACWNRVRCSTNHFVRLFYLINICFEMFVIKMFDQK